MIYLLDVNFLIALCDPYHAHHNGARRWFTAERARSWATCALTENGFVRITSNRNYPGGHGTVVEQMQTLSKLCAVGRYSFWPDDLSIIRDDIWSPSHVINPNHLTDLYLLSLAVKRNGKLASFDRNIPASCVRAGPGAMEIVQG